MTDQQIAATHAAQQQAARAVRTNSTTMIMGPTGSGKSSLLATFAEWVWETHRKVTRLVSTDPGGFPDKVLALQRKGIMQVWRARTRDLPDGSLSFETCLRAAAGWWPRRWNPITGECAPGERLLPPITEQYTMHCPNNHPIKIVPFQSMLTPGMCTVCKTHTTKQNMRVTKVGYPTKGFEQVGGVCLDGISSMLSWMMEDMGKRAGRLELKGEEGAIGGKVISGDLKMGSVTRSHVGFGQTRAEEICGLMLSIPNLVAPPVITALTLEVTDEGGLPVRGPKLVGKARTDEAGAWVGNTLETAVIRDDRDRRVFRVYLSEFTDETGVKHLCKNRAAAGTLPPWLEDPPLGDNDAETSFTQFNLGVFFTLLDAGLGKELDRINAKYPDLPDIDAGFVEIGETVMERVPEDAQGVPAAQVPAASAPAVTAPVPPPPAPKPTVVRPVARPAARPKPAPAPAPAPVEAEAPAPVEAAPVVEETPTPVEVQVEVQAAAASAPIAVDPPAALPPAVAKPRWAPPATRPPAPTPRIRPPLTGGPR